MLLDVPLSINRISPNPTVLEFFCNQCSSYDKDEERLAAASP